MDSTTKRIGPHSVLGKLIAERERLETLLKDFDRGKIQKRVAELKTAELILIPFAPQAKTSAKMRKLAEAAEARAERLPQHRGRKDVAVAEQARQVVLEAIGDTPLKSVVLIKTTGIPESRLRNYLTTLKTKKLIRNTTQGWIRA